MQLVLLYATGDQSDSSKMLPKETLMLVMLITLPLNAIVTVTARNNLYICRNA
jgi:hypothetical protein